MSLRRYIWPALATVILLIGAWLLLKAGSSKPTVEWLAVPNPAILVPYRQGGRSSDDMLAAQWQEENKTPQDFYGRVIDQFGDPVAHAGVNGDLVFLQGFDLGEKREVHTTQTDAKGEFEFTGLHGSGLAVAPSKSGYELAPNTSAMRLPAVGKTSPSNRAVFSMWKLKGGEPMTHASVHAYIPCDGSKTRFNLLTGKQSPDGDLIVKLTRNPVNIIRGRPFDWTLALELPAGGLQKMATIYPNEAPISGYQPAFIIDFPAKMPAWSHSFAQAFYFKSRDGQAYGRMTVKIMANFQPPPTLFDGEVYANPAGSRNLEFDRTKQIQ